MMHFGAGEGCPPAVADLAQLGVREVPATVLAPNPGGGPGPAVADQLATGTALADAEVDAGADLIVLSLSGMEVLAPVLVSVLSGIEPVKLLPRGTRLTVAQWSSRAVAVRDSRRQLLGFRDDPDALLGGACQLAAELAGVSGTEVCSLGAACGVLLQATARRTPVILDGLGAMASAALCAEAVPLAMQWCRAAELGADPAQDSATAQAATEPVFPVPVGGPPGTAGALAVLSLRVAVRAALAG
jgi:nicotinate-nucleotide--dimethylbenzimidazole phosphoribosyltransferase